MKVYECINNVQADLSKTGISKDERNFTQQYNFRGIDSVYNALAPLLALHGLCILPKVLERTVTERITQKGGVLFYVVVKVEFCFVCAEDFSSHIICTYGEAMDSGDKATNKAMSAAYKYAAIQAFCIPTEGDNDADATTHEVKIPPNVSAKPTDDINAMSELKKLIEDRVLQNKIESWCEYFKVESLDDLSEHNAVSLINTIKGKN